MFTGPILVFFQKYPQNRSKAPKQCPMTILDHRECSKPPDPGLEADLRISWLEGSISLDFAVRASRNISEMGIQNNTIDLKNTLYCIKVPKVCSPTRILLLDWPVCHISLQSTQFVAQIGSFFKPVESVSRLNLVRNVT